MLRTALEKRGYWLVAKSVLPFGIDYLCDIRRLAETHRVPIQCFFDIGAHEGTDGAGHAVSVPRSAGLFVEPHPISFSY